MIEVVRTVEFDAGHRVATHDGKCRHPHGHRYRVELRVEGPLPDSGMVVDFGVLAELLEVAVHVPLDHSFMVDVHDTEMCDALDGHGWKVVELAWPPTAENIGRWVVGQVHGALVEANLRLVSVTVYETPKSWAVVTV